MFFVKGWDFMLGFSSSIWVMFKIVEILDTQTDYISSEKVLELVGDSNISQIKKLTRELKEDIEECYTEKEVKLTISKRNGLKLYRRSTSSLQRLIIRIASKDLAYSIYKTLLIERSVRTSEFYQSNFISLSTLQRKVKEINQHLNTLGLHITLSKHLTLHGKESTIRCFSFQFLYMIHRQISNIYWNDNNEYYLALAKKINQQMGLNFARPQEEILGLHLFVTYTAIQTNHELLLEEEAFPFFNEIGFPKKPSFLTSMPENDWKFLTLIIHNSNLSNYEIPLDFSSIEFTELNHDFQIWMELFEKYFTSINATQKLFLYDFFLKLYLDSFFLKLDDALLCSFPGNILSLAREPHPYYLAQFNKFWEAFAEKSGTWGQNYIKNQCLLLCEYLLPETNFLPKIKIYLYTHLSTIIFEQIKSAIESHFFGKYTFIFVSNPKESDLIVGTVHYPDITLTRKQRFILIQVFVTQQDYEHLDDAINDLLLDEF